MRLARLKYDCGDIERLGPYWIFNRHVSLGLWDVPFPPISTGGTRSDWIARLRCRVARMRGRFGLVVEFTVSAVVSARSNGKGLLEPGQWKSRALAPDGVKVHQEPGVRRGSLTFSDGPPFSRSQAELDDLSGFHILFPPGSCNQVFLFFLM